jgi:hypothetical protein
MIVVSIIDARRLADEYLCSDCWEVLTVYPEGNAYNIKCVTPGCTTPGCTSRKYVDKHHAINAMQWVEARIVLKDALPWLKTEARSIDQNLRDLGF